MRSAALMIMMVLPAFGCGDPAETLEEQPLEIGETQQELSDPTGPLCQDIPSQTLVCEKYCDGSDQLACLSKPTCHWDLFEGCWGCEQYRVQTSSSDACQSIPMEECSFTADCWVQSVEVAASLYRHSYERNLISQLGPGMSQNLNRGNDEASSIRVSPGYCVRVYKHANFSGSSLLLRSGGHGLGSLNDEVTSWAVVDCPPPPPPQPQPPPRPPCPRCDIP